MGFGQIVECSDCGGATDTQPATEKTQNMIDELKGDIYDKAGKEYPQLKAISFRDTWGLAGRNCFVKVHCGDNNYIHMRISIDFEEKYTVESVALNKTLNDEVYLNDAQEI